MTPPVLVTGSGCPVTVAAHGLGASLPETRLLVSGVPGTRVLYSARGHGGLAPVVPGWGELADDLRQVADAHGATQALGVSMGAATLLRLLCLTPERFDRVVLLLPSAVATQRTDDAVRRLAGLAASLRAGERASVLSAVTRELPEDLLEVPAVAAYARSRTEFLLSCEGLPALLDSLPGDVPVVDRSALAGVTAEVLVVAQEGDPLHPAWAARELVDLLPRSRLVVFDRPGMVFRERPRLRAEISGFLS